MKRREDFTKIAEILIRAKRGIKPTHLLSDTRLRHGPGYEIFEKLLNLHLLRIVPVIGDSNARWPASLFETTDKGGMFIDRVLECYRMIDDNHFEEIIKKVRAV